MRFILRLLDAFTRWRSEPSFDTERAQAVVRIVILALLSIYLLPVLASKDTPASGWNIYWAYAGSFLSSWFLLSWIIYRPGENHWRRACAMMLDYGAMTYAMSVGGAPLLPVSALVLWVTVGYGLRYGARYLGAAAAIALSSFAITTYFNDYWRQNHYVVLTMAAMAILVPAYIFALLNRLHRANAAQQEANLSKSRFLAQASHDLRQPIHAISLFTACLRDAGLQPSELAMVDNIDRSLQSVSRLFKALLDISTLDSGKMTPEAETVAISEIIGDIVNQNSEAAQIAGSQFRVVRCAKFIEIDRGLLNTMLQNIVSNAIKYAPGHPILIGCRRTANGLAIQVYDRGPGIEQEHQSRLFEEFYQVRNRGDKDLEGVGLGLAIVKRLAILMNLDVSLKSVVGRGTCVTISGLEIAKPRVRNRAQSSTPVALTGGLRILLVEDDEAVLLATASLLRKWGCSVQAETTVPERVDECDLLITDFDLGDGMTGTECIARVRLLTGWKVPAVVMSGHDAARVREDLADDEIPILSKPVRPAELRSAILLPTITARAG